MSSPKLKYGIGNAASTTLSSGMTNTDTSAPLTSSTNFQAAPTPGEGQVLIDEGNATEELAYATGISGGSLTIPLANRGLEGGSPQAHSASSSIKGDLTVGMWNDMITALLNILVQSTGAIDITKLGTAGYVVDTGAANAYVATLVPVLASYTAGTIVRFKAANANTTTATLNVNGLGVKTIKKLDGATNLASGDIIAGQIVTCVYDGTNFQMISPLGSVPSIAGTDGWTTLGTTLTYTSVDGHTFVVGTSGDVTGTVQVGDRVKFTNNSTTFYGIVTAITASTMTLYGGTSYSVANSAITNPSYSHAKAPYGFNTDPLIWTEKVSDTSNRDQTNPTAATWYNPGTVKLDIPIGEWNLSYEVSAIASYQTAAGVLNVKTAVSNSNNSVGDTDLQSHTEFSLGSGTFSIITGTHSRSKNILLASKTTYYVIIYTDYTLGGTGLLRLAGGAAPTRIRAVCAYL